MKLVILGGSGSGKSTQAEMLCTNLNVPIISTGEVLRKAISNSSNLGIRAQPYLEAGELVPDEMMIEFIKNHLKEPEFQGGWLLEGYPRTAFQAEELDFLLEELGQQLNWVIYLQVTQDAMIARCLDRSLPDDQPEIIQRRIELFYERTIPILEYYDRRCRLLKIDGDRSSEEVQQSIKNLI
ncbi:adenylate kinase family protein [Mastigocoleus testarum]|uniref:Adenylate kinase n=1 Tax=Mastigocoleus testarum BC008 TaxID=371196 RepID=A0A0V7ZFC2_9CYAN|nr:nucleoside monophosphate kinase [Mastigocoleus testarum]KST63145.1 adenylate kinase [Mastigocoleus testarum BC008]KST63211.1 adenylate kinase [Mastigocoleus testarum BC008]